jgi:hypothetical protein
MELRQAQMQYAAYSAMAQVCYLRCYMGGNSPRCRVVIPRRHRPRAPRRRRRVSSLRHRRTGAQARRLPAMRTPTLLTGTSLSAPTPARPTDVTYSSGPHTATTSTLRSSRSGPRRSSSSTANTTPRRAPTSPGSPPRRRPQLPTPLRPHHRPRPHKAQGASPPSVPLCVSSVYVGALFRCRSPGDTTDFLPTVYMHASKRARARCVFTTAFLFVIDLKLSGYTVAFCVRCLVCESDYTFLSHAFGVGNSRNESSATCALSS